MRMALKPLLKSKVDELFARWLSDPETQLHLKENLRQLCHGESITLQYLTSPKSSSKQSPRLRPSSPPCSPSSTKLSNPRSPRRTLSNKNKSNNGSPRVRQLYSNDSISRVYICIRVFIIGLTVNFWKFDMLYLFWVCMWFVILLNEKDIFDVCAKNKSTSYMLWYDFY